MNQALERIEKNAQALMGQYKASAQLLTVPHLSQIEQLATQLVAIIMASEPQEPARSQTLRDVEWKA